MQVVDGAGQVRLDTYQTTLLRVVHIEDLPGDFSGSFDVPEFDDTRGFFVPLWRPIMDGAWPNGFSRLTPYRQGANSGASPKFHWSAPTLTVTFSYLPSGFSTPVIFAPSYSVRFYHYR